MELAFKDEQKIDVSKLKKIKPNTVRVVVHKWLLEHVGHPVIGTDIEHCDSGHPLSGNRIMRYLRTEGWCRVPCVQRSGSRYFVEFVVDLDGTIIRSFVSAEEYVKRMIALGYKYKLEG